MAPPIPRKKDSKARPAPTALWPTNGQVKIESLVLSNLRRSVVGYSPLTGYRGRKLLGAVAKAWRPTPTTLHHKRLRSTRAIRSRVNLTTEVETVRPNNVTPQVLPGSASRYQYAEARTSQPKWSVALIHQSVQLVRSSHRLAHGSRYTF